MKIIKAGYEIFKPDLDDPKTEQRIYRMLEKIGRVCYKSEAQITDESSEKFIRRLITNGHEAMLEHEGMTVKFTVDRGVSHEMVRHRLCSFAQESQRYCSYNKDKFGNEITVIEPCFFMDIPKTTRENIQKVLSGEEQLEILGEITDHMKAYARWHDACMNAEKEYMNLLSQGCTPQEARSVLPNSTKTEIVITTNFREWRQIFRLRAAGVTGKPHPQMLEVMVPLLNECKLKLPALFDDISPLEID